MLTIRDEQMRALGEYTRRQFEGRLVDHLESFFADQCEVLGGRGLREAVRHGLRRARSYGLSSERDACQYLDLMFTFGRDFDTRADMLWAGQALGLQGRPATKMDRLMDRALEEADGGRGFAAEQGADSREPAMFVRRRPFDEDRSEEWTRTMTELICHYCREEPFFRWDDSRDLESVEHLRAICEVARRTPEIRQWLPTRALGIVRSFFGTRAEELPANLLLRIQASDADTPASSIAGLPTATCHATSPPLGTECRQPDAAGACGTCRICWSADVRNVSFAPGRWRGDSARSAA